NAESAPNCCRTVPGLPQLRDEPRHVGKEVSWNGGARRRFALTQMMAPTAPRSSRPPARQHQSAIVAVAGSRIIVWTAPFVAPNPRPRHARYPRRAHSFATAG